MEIWTLFFIAVGLSMDAFAVACINGLCTLQKQKRYAMKVGLYFGFFQGLMTLSGWLIGILFLESMIGFNTIISFFLLSFIGLKMIWNFYKNKDIACDVYNVDSQQSLILFAIATSIDALAIGISLALIDIDIVTVSIFIASITFVFSFFGVRLGSQFGDKIGRKAELLGGTILCVIGLKILLENLL